MREKLGAELWFKEHLIQARSFIRSADEKALMRYHEESRTKHKFEIIPLKGENLFSKFIKMLSEENRRVFLLDAENTWLTYEELEPILGVTSKKISNFIKMKNKRSEGDLAFLTKIALVCRAPLHWLIRSLPEDTYDHEHLLYLPDADYTTERLMKFFSDVNKYTRDVRGIRLITTSGIICLRVEVLFGAILIEIINRIDESLFVVLKDTIAHLNPVPGRFRTLIENRIHHGFYCHFRANEMICLPIEFYSYQANWQDINYL